MCTTVPLSLVTKAFIKSPAGPGSSSILFEHLLLHARHSVPLLFLLKPYFLLLTIYQLPRMKGLRRAHGTSTLMPNHQPKLPLLENKSSTRCVTFFGDEGVLYYSILITLFVYRLSLLGVCMCNMVRLLEEISVNNTIRLLYNK